MKEIGIVFNVQRFTIHDGPGMRTELFLKGCPLRCPWCGNPESHRPYRERAFIRASAYPKRSAVCACRYADVREPSYSTGEG